MDHDVFLRRLGSLHPVNPPKEALCGILLEAYATLKPSKLEVHRLSRAFDLSYAGHFHAPTRASGEAYIFHIIRAVLDALKMMEMFGVHNHRLAIQLILHDTVEDAEEGGYRPLLMRSNILLTTGIKNARGVSFLTKHDVFGNVKPHYYAELVGCGMWEPLAGKHIDRTDNMRTLWAMPREKQLKKILETEREFPALTNAMFENAIKRIERGRFHQGYIPLCGMIAQTLQNALQTERRRLGMT